LGAVQLDIHIRRAANVTEPPTCTEFGGIWAHLAQRLVVVPAGLTPEPHAALGLALPRFVELVGATAAD
jgi:hypothetical protein